MLVFVLNNQDMLHVERSGEERNQTAAEKLFSTFLLNFFFVLENAVGARFVTNCALAEPLLKECEIAFGVRKACLKSTFIHQWTPNARSELGLMLVQR